MTRKTTVAQFPVGYFLENICVLPDHSLVVSCANHGEIYHIEAPISGHGLIERKPKLLHKFSVEHGQWAMGVITAPQCGNICYALSTDFINHTRSHLYVLDIAHEDQTVGPSSIMTFPDEIRALNGFCALSESVLLAADSFASCIWRIDLDTSTFPPKSASVSRWLTHDIMYAELHLPDFQPGTNGLKHCRSTGTVCFSSTQQKLFCQVSVDPETLEAQGEPQIVAQGMQGDDFIIDETAKDGPVALLTTHRENTLLRIPLKSRAQGMPLSSQDCAVADQVDVEAEVFIGPTAGAWAPGEEGKVAYFTTDGGLKSPLPDGRVRPAKVVRVEFD